MNCFRCISIISLYLLLSACALDEINTHTLNPSITYTVIDPVTGNQAGKLTANGDSGYVLERSKSSTYTDSGSNTTLVFTTIGHVKVMEDILVMGDQIHSGYKVFNRWGEELPVTHEMVTSIKEEYPLPYCWKVTIEGNKLILL